MKAIYITGSPRQKEDSNTDYLLNLVKEETGGQILKLADYSFQPCHSCWKFREKERCIIRDDLTEEIFPGILESDVLVRGSPVYFNNVSVQMKTFIDRTWSIKGELRNKIGGAVVVGRKYGAESAITTINAFFLKHEMIPANRGVHGEAFQEEEVSKDEEAVQTSKRLGKELKNSSKSKWENKFSKYKSWTKRNPCNSWLRFPEI